MTSTVLVALSVTVRRSWATWAAAGKSSQSGTSATLIVRVTRRPRSAVFAVLAGMSFHGSFLSLWCRPGMFALTVYADIGIDGLMPLLGLCRVCWCSGGEWLWDGMSGADAGSRIGIVTGLRGRRGRCRRAGSVTVRRWVGRLRRGLFP